MAKFRRKSVVEATQWFKNGDHPEDNRETFTGSDGKPFLGEGKVVRYYRTPKLDGQDKCQECDDIMHNHGWIDETNDSVVCPGDWVITIGERHTTCKPNVFEKMYERWEYIEKYE